MPVKTKNQATPIQKGIKSGAKKFILNKIEGQSPANLISLACDHHKEKALH